MKIEGELLVKPHELNTVRAFRIEIEPEDECCDSTSLAGIPEFGDEFTGDDGVVRYCVTKEVRRLTPKLVEVRCLYDTVVPVTV